MDLYYIKWLIKKNLVCAAFRFVRSAATKAAARLENGAEGKPVKLDYLSSSALPNARTQASDEGKVVAVPNAAAKVHITSEPSGGEIYIDGKFFGNAPSDINPAAGEHTVKVTIGGKEWTRTEQITCGEIQLRAELP